MRFLHVCLSESWGGLEMAILKWNKILQEKGHSNFNVCTPNSPLAQALKEEGLPLVEWDSAHYFSPDFSFKLRKLVKEKKFHALILQNLRDLWIVSPALYNIKKTQLVGFCQMLVGVKKKDPLHKLVYKRLNHLLTLTDWQQTALLPYLPIKKEIFSTIPNFVDSKIFHPKLRSDDFRYQLGFKQEDFVIGIIGRIDEQKGQLELLKAFAKVSEQFKKVHLLIIGEPTLGEEKQEKYFNHLKEQVTKNKLDKKVHFMGFQKETQTLTANLDLFVLASHQETFGYVVIEAMACGVPVLGTQAGGVPEILDHGDCGFLCEPKNWEDMAKKLDFILNNPSERQEKADKGLIKARDFYDRNKVYDRFIELIQKSRPKVLKLVK